MVDAMAKAARLDRNFRKVYGENGFLSSDVCGSSVSQTLEYAYDDWCIARMAEDLNMDAIAKEFYERAQSYKNLVHPIDQMVRPKNRSFFIEPFEPREVNFHYTEANGWQYNFYYPHDVKTMVEYHGGANAYEARLDSFFTMSSDISGGHQADITGLIGQYAHGNEPSHHSAYLYHFVNNPHQSQMYVHKILNELYSDEPDGVCGNEDCGQMSAWFVMSSLGLYPFNPADGNYLLIAPLMNEAHVQLANDKSLKINKLGKGEFIKSISYNGNAWLKSYISHSDISTGGTLTYQMTSDANQACGKQLTPPPSHTKEHLIVPVPAIVAGERSYFDSTAIHLAGLDNNEILYTLDGSDPENGGISYKDPIVLKESAFLRAFAQNADGKRSKEIQSQMNRIKERKTIKIHGSYAAHYAAGGDNALVNGIEGGLDYRSGEWQGYQGIDLVADIELPVKRHVENVKIRFLQDQNSWIFQPEVVEFYQSADGLKWEKISEQKNTLEAMEDGTILKQYRSDINKSTKHLRVVAKNRGTCPDGHKGNGGKSWIFADEIFIN